MYTEKVMDHFAHPRNMGEIKDANGVGMVGNAKCGDIMQMFLKVNDDGIIEDVGFNNAVIVDFRLRCGCCNQQHGNGTYQGQEH